MSCGVGVSGTFSPLNDTWSKASDLRMNSWDPYPELKAPFTCFPNSVKEGFCGDGNGSCGGIYQQGNDIVAYQGPSVYTSFPIQTQAIKRENYVGYPSPYNNAREYQELNNSWSLQKPYTT